MTVLSRTDSSGQFGNKAQGRLFLIKVLKVAKMVTFEQKRHLSEQKRHIPRGGETPVKQG